MKITKKDHLQKIRTAVHDSLYVPTLLKMNVGMATCGIAAGAKEVYDLSLIHISEPTRRS